jgi:6-pyruvoyltetrahydropterin/6-carboxytetrahydropterin synthase
MRVTKRFAFEAAHILPLHDGKCSRLHGHNYVVEVTAEGNVHTEGPKTGMVVDFGDLKEVFNREVKEKLDHRNLNDVLDFTTTAENLAMWILQVMHLALPKVVKVVVYETPDSFAEANGRDFARNIRLH